LTLNFVPAIRPVITSLLVRSYLSAVECDVTMRVPGKAWGGHLSGMSMTVREIILFIGKPKGRSRMISIATNPLKESRKESLLRCAGSTSICVWLVCDLVVMCVQAVGDRALGDLCVCVRCGSVQSQKV